MSLLFATSYDDERREPGGEREGVQQDGREASRSKFQWEKIEWISMVEFAMARRPLCTLGTGRESDRTLLKCNLRSNKSPTMAPTQPDNNHD